MIAANNKAKSSKDTIGVFVICDDGSLLFLFPSGNRQLKAINYNQNLNGKKSIITFSGVTQILTSEPGKLTIVYKDDGFDTTETFSFYFDEQNNDALFKFDGDTRARYLKCYSNERVLFLANEICCRGFVKR